ncbi:MAG: two pore domain potassium channel family protein, partial [Lentimicrobiaceae bacterium]|nr:two pore domain potassium channel family protein [Lentimicrobiaceae bacterium]
ITLTTIGYGEITPLSVPARSVSILMGVMGQIYLTVIIAMIVSKYMTGKKQTN